MPDPIEQSELQEQQNILQNQSQEEKDLDSYIHTSALPLLTEEEKEQLKLSEESSHNNEKDDLPSCNICLADGPWIGCSSCNRTICKSCLSDTNPLQCKICSPNLDIKAQPLTEEIYDPIKDEVKVVTHHGKYFKPVGTAMITTCGKISQMPEEILEKSIQEYAGFVKEAEETLDRRRVFHAMLKAEKNERNRLKYRTGDKLPEDALKRLNKEKDEDDILNGPKKLRSPNGIKRKANASDLLSLLKAMTPEQQAVLIASLERSKIRNLE